MDLEEEVQTKRKEVVDEKNCVICEKSLEKDTTKNPVVKNPSKEGLKSLTDATEIRKDELYDLLWPMKDDVLSGKQKVLFHKNCRANYTSKHNLQCVKRKQEALHTLQRKSEEAPLVPED